LQGQVTFAAKSTSFADIAGWLKTVRRPKIFPTLQGVWVTSATATAATDTAPTVDFASAGELTDAARSNRLTKFQGGAQ
jgi:hypothetical protein